MITTNKTVYIIKFETNFKAEKFIIKGFYLGEKVIQLLTGEIQKELQFGKDIQKAKTWNSKSYADKAIDKIEKLYNYEVTGKVLKLEIVNIYKKPIEV